MSSGVQLGGAINWPPKDKSVVRLTRELNCIQAIPR